MALEDDNDFWLDMDALGTESRRGCEDECYYPWGSMSRNNAYIGPQCLQIVPTLGYLEP